MRRLNGIIAMATLAATASTLPARPPELDGRLSGTFTGTNVDLNGDGQRGHVTTASIHAGSGFGALSGYTETRFVGVNTARCPGEVDNDYVANSASLTDAQGDQLWLVLDEGHLCLNPANGAISRIVLEQTVAGGSGAYAGATGTAHIALTGQALDMEPTRLAFGTFTGDFTVSLDE